MVSIYIALYLFLAGTGAGAFLIGAVVDMVLRFRPRAAGGWFERVSAVTDAGLILGPVLVAVSALFLFLDLGVPDRVFHLFLASTSSLLSMGAWAILVFCVMATLALVLGSLADGEGDGYEYELAPGKVVLRVCEFACSLVAMGMALFVVVYSGIFLAMYPSLPLSSHRMGSRAFRGFSVGVRARGAHSDGVFPLGFAWHAAGYQCAAAARYGLRRRRSACFSGFSCQLLCLGWASGHLGSVADEREHSTAVLGWGSDDGACCAFLR